MHRKALEGPHRYNGVTVCMHLTKIQLYSEREKERRAIDIA